MLHLATDEERALILSKVADSANEGMANGSNIITQEKAEFIISSLLIMGAQYMVLRDHDGSMIGWTLIGENIDYMTDHRFGFIYDVFIFPEYRGNGLSKVLVKEAVKDLKNQGYKEVRLNVFEDNFAKEIYKKLGFIEVQSMMKMNTDQV
ncbi:GNAT family N-acetyltransferase [Evansella halocellulosilytica]|uniref:GNAT family N-acetyltransferase n=1 Tax=Evansella halocellulosilytica TaxID=2011013 RepID=UPI000BB72545|nr:GNAT family N-acetyltransferase [Evansella halocellulosilytica]